MAHKCLGAYCMHPDHLYKEGGKAKHEPEFEERYGKKKGEHVYGAVVGEIYREQHHGRNWNQKRKKS